MATLLDRAFDVSLGVSAEAFDTISNADGDMTHVASTSPFDSSNGYVNVVVDDTTANFGTISFTASATGVIQYAQYLDLDTLAISTDTHAVRLIKLWDGTNTGEAPVEIDIINNGGTRAIKVYGNADGDGASAKTATYNIGANSPTWIEFRCNQAATNSSADGAVTCWIGGGDYAAGGVEIAALTAIDNFDEFADTDQMRLGATNISTSVSGQYQFDRPRANDAGTAYFVVENAAPTVSDPGTQETGLGYALAIGTLFTVADTDSNLSTIRYQCGETKGDITVTLGSCTVSSGTNGTHDFTITGTHANLLSTHATAVYVSTAENTTDTVTVTATDDAAASDSQAITVNLSYLTIGADTQADLNTQLGQLTAQSAEVGAYTVSIVGIADDSLEGTGEGTVTVSVPDAVSGVGTGISSTKLSYSLGLHW